MSDEQLQFFVVDDDAFVLAQLKAVFSQKADVAGAGEGMEALRQLDEMDPDIIFLDIGLPDMTGFELIRHIKRREHLSNVPIVMITTNDEIKNHVMALELGADEFLAKPIDNDLAHELVNKVVRARKTNLSISEISRYENSFAISLMENLVTPTFVINADGYVVIWNKACEQLTGLTASEVIGTKNHWKGFYESSRICLVDMLLPKNRKAGLDINKLYNEVISDDVDHTLHAENWCVMPIQGDKKYLAIDAGPIYDANGRLIAAVETLSDLTELKETQSKFERLSTIDELTGLGNRRFFDVQLDALWFSTLRHRQQISMLMMDVDYFKYFNDHYGHPKGDECLKVVAGVISGSLSRSMDMAFRYGGEEFCVLLPDTDTKGAQQVAQRILSSLNSIGMEHEKSQHANKVVSVSIGVCTLLPTRETDSSALILAADEALYTAKASGRARYVVAEQSL